MTTISNDWDVDFVNKVIRHNDGVVNYDTNTGTVPALYDYVRATNSGTTFQIINGSDLGGTDGTGTLTITSTTGKLQDGDPLDPMSVLYFDGVVNGGFALDSTLRESDGTSFSGAAIMVVRAVEYDGTAGAIFGELSGGTFVDDDGLADVGDATTLLASAALTDTNGDGTNDTVQTDNSALFTGALTNGAAITPASNSKIVHYDTGTAVIPRFAKVQNAIGSDATSGFAQQVIGVQTTGSLKLVDSQGTWANNDTIYVANYIAYNNQQAGQKFRVNDFVTFHADATSDSTGEGKIIEVTDTNPTGSVVIFNVSGSYADNDVMKVNDVFVADVDDVSGNFTDSRALANAGVGLTDPEVTQQFATQGGLYETSLNPVRDANALYTYLQDTFDELGALDDTVPMSAQVRLQQYTLINGWVIPDLSFRFIESGSIQDSALANIWTNYATLGSVEGITDLGFLPQVVQPPQIYIEQNGSVISPWWIGGQIDVLVKVRTASLPTLDSADGQLINGGTVTIFAREFNTLYDHFETTTIAGVAPIPLATSSDINNASGTHSFVGTGDVSLFTVGELITDTSGPDEEKRGVIKSITGTTGGTIEYSLVGDTQFVNTNAIIGAVSANTDTINSVPASVVAGLGAQIIISTVEATITGSGSTGTFVPGEELVQDTTGAKAVLMNHDTGTETITVGNMTAAEAATANNSANWVGQTSAATQTPTAIPSTATVINRDIGDGNGDQPYKAVLYLNTDGAGEGDTLANMYEWIKYNTRSKESAGEPPSPEFDRLGGPGTGDDGVVGQIYITLDSTYPVSKQSPFGTFAGGTFFGAQGVFVQDMANADIRNYQLLDNNGVLRNPPNQQVLTVAGLVSGDRVAVFRRINSTPGSAILSQEWEVAAFDGTHGYNGLGDTVIRVDATIQADHPSSGVIRTENSSTGLFESRNYTSFTSSGTAHDFTLDATLDRSLTATEDVYVPLLQVQADAVTESSTIIYLANIPLLARVRKKGILPFEVEGTFGSGGVTITAIRTTDTIVD